MAYMEYPWLQSGPDAAQYFTPRPTTTAANPAGAWAKYAAPGPFDNLSSFQSHYFFQDSPQTAFRQYLDYLDPNPNSAFSRYAADARDRLYQQYLGRQSQPGHANDLWTDFLSGLGGQLPGEFSALSPSQRGEHPLQFSRWLA